MRSRGSLLVLVFALPRSRAEMAARVDPPLPLHGDQDAGAPMQRVAV